MADKEELIWVDAEFAQKYNELKGDKSKREEQLKALDEYIVSIREQSRKEFRANLDSLEEDVAIYVGLMVSVKQKFEAAKTEQLQASYSLWEKFDKELPNIQDKTNKMIECLNPLVEKLTQVNELLGKIQIYNFNDVIKAIERIGNLYGESKGMVEFLVNNYKNEKRLRERRRDESTERLLD